MQIMTAFGVKHISNILSGPQGTLYIIKNALHGLFRGCDMTKPNFVLRA